MQSEYGQRASSCTRHQRRVALRAAGYDGSAPRSERHAPREILDEGRQLDHQMVCRWLRRDNSPYRQPLRGAGVARDIVDQFLEQTETFGELALLAPVHSGCRTIRRKPASRVSQSTGRRKGHRSDRRGTSSGNCAAAQSNAARASSGRPRSASADAIRKCMFRLAGR